MKIILKEHGDNTGFKKVKFKKRIPFVMIEPGTYFWFNGNVYCAIREIYDADTIHDTYVVYYNCFDVKHGHLDKMMDNSFVVPLEIKNIEVEE